jgi:hypothetical protein
VRVIKLVSGDSLRKTGIFAIKAGDFQQIAQDRRTSSPETKSNVQNAGFSRPFSRFLGNLAERMNAWPGRKARTPASLAITIDAFRRKSEATRLRQQLKSLCLVNEPTDANCII